MLLIYSIQLRKSYPERPFNIFFYEVKGLTAYVIRRRTVRKSRYWLYILQIALFISGNTGPSGHTSSPSANGYTSNGDAGPSGHTSSPSANGYTWGDVFLMVVALFFVGYLKVVVALFLVGYLTVVPLFFYLLVQRSRLEELLHLLTRLSLILQKRFP